MAGNIHAEFIEEMRALDGKEKEHPSSLFHSHALAAALAYADVIEGSPEQLDPDAASAWKLSGRPGFSNALRR
jgi:hypothetical protein